jgi:hypothetical protein
VYVSMCIYIYIYIYIYVYVYVYIYIYLDQLYVYIYVYINIPDKLARMHTRIRTHLGPDERTARAAVGSPIAADSGPEERSSE